MQTILRVRFIKAALEDGVQEYAGARKGDAHRAGVLEGINQEGINQEGINQEGVSQRNAGSQAVNVPENILENVESHAAVLEDTVEEVGTHVVVTRNY
jgi:hypothetical protein